MRRSAVIFWLGGLLLSLAWLAGCGSSSSTKTGVGAPAKMVIAPASTSVEQGGAVQLVAQVEDANGTPIFSKTIAYSSSNTAVGTVATGGTSAGLVCGGTWDSLTTPIVCTPGSVGVITITATDAADNLSASATVFVHAHVTSITLSPASVNCDSQTQTTQFTATAFNGATNITSSVGAFSWFSNDSNVVTIVADTSNPAILNVGTATAVNPGLTTVFAAVGGTNSVAANFTTCPVQSIFAHVVNSTATSFSVAVGSTQQLAADVTDTAGKTLSNVPLTWTSSTPPIANVNSSAVVNGISQGQAGIVASCSPPTCNNNLNTPVYSNVVNATVTGASATLTVYATSTQFNPACPTAPSNTCTSIVPIAASTNTPSTAVALQANQVPNSLAFDPLGTTAYMGSSAGLMLFNANSNTMTGTVTNAIGKVLAVSPNGVKIIVSNPGTDVTVYDSSASTVQTLNITAAVAADFTPDSLKAYIVSGNTLYVYSPGLALRTVALGGTGNDVNFLSNGSFGYVAGGASPVQVYAACDNSLQDTVTTAAAPTFIRKAPGTLKMAAVDSPNLEIITAAPTTPPPPCPVTLTDSLTTVNTGVSFTPNALIITPDGSKALITSNLAEVTMVNLSTNAVTHIALTGGAHAFTGGVTLDSTTLYVGASDGKVHVINLGTGTDSATPITISFPNQAAGLVPDLVAVKP